MVHDARRAGELVFWAFDEDSDGGEGGVHRAFSGRSTENVFKNGLWARGYTRWVMLELLNCWELTNGNQLEICNEEGVLSQGCMTGIMDE